MNKFNENPNGKYRTVEGACGDVNMGRNTLMRIAGEANAIIRVGRSVRIDMGQLCAYIDSVYKVNQ